MMAARLGTKGIKNKMTAITIHIDERDFECRDFCLLCREVHHVHNQTGLCVKCFKITVEAAEQPLPKKNPVFS